MTTAILLVARSSEALYALSARLPRAGEPCRVVQQTGGVSEVCAAIRTGDVDLAVADLPSWSDADLALIESALAANPRTSLVLVCNDSSSEFLLRAMRAGVREIVLPDSPPDALAKAVTRQFERRAGARSPARKARAVAFLSAKGGGGATFLATNLGFALAARGQRVALFDLNLQFGDASLFVSDQPSPRNIGDVAREIDRLDPAFLEANMTQPRPGYFVLASPDMPERAMDVGPETIERIFGVARGGYDFIVLDVGRVLDRVAVRALDEADTVYIVIQSTLPYLHNARRLIDVLGGLGYERDKLKIVLNRYVKNDEIGVDEIEKALGVTVSAQVPNSYAAVAYSINHGLPLTEHAPRDPVARRLAEMAESLAPAQRQRRGLLRGLLGGR